ncbi:MAG: hypothetical protein KAR38_13970, partial [Calditrichia bacterium]|nr:hypothetical protein [Calditrichia bacterium]
QRLAFTFGGYRSKIIKNSESVTGVVDNNWYNVQGTTSGEYEIVFSGLCAGINFTTPVYRNVELVTKVRKIYSIQSKFKGTTKTFQNIQMQFGLQYSIYKGFSI